MPTPNENLSIRLPSDKREKLDSIAASIDRSRNWLINEIVDDYLAEYDRQTAIIQQRLERAENGGTFHSHDDVMQRIAARINARLAQ